MDVSHILCNTEAAQEADLLATSKQSIIHSCDHTGNDGTDQPLIIPVPDALSDDTDDCTSDLPSFKRNNALSHFSLYRSECNCDPCCMWDGAENLALSFAAMSELARVNTVRSMLLAIVAPAGDVNQLMVFTDKYTAGHKRKRISDDGETRVTTEYTLRGRRVCRALFAAVVQMHPQTISRYAAEVGKNAVFGLQVGNEGMRRTVIFTIQTQIVLLFLRRFAEVNGMACPSGRETASEAPVIFLSSDITKLDVHEKYKSSWEDLLQAALFNAGRNVKRPLTPLTNDSFCKIWKHQLPTLRIMKVGSDFCDTCTKLANIVATVTDTTTKQSLWNARQKHRLEAANEFINYRTLQTSVRESPNQTIHVVFDFAEKVLLPHLLRQPGQQHFVTGIKFDIFGVSCSNIGKTLVYGLPEGHWSGGKTATEVGSMIHHALYL